MRKYTHAIILKKNNGGDGGSSIKQLDALNKTVVKLIPNETKQQQQHWWRAMMMMMKMVFDAIVVFCFIFKKSTAHAIRRHTHALFCGRRRRCHHRCYWSFIIDIVYFIIICFIRCRAHTCFRTAQRKTKQQKTRKIKQTLSLPIERKEDLDRWWCKRELLINLREAVRIAWNFIDRTIGAACNVQFTRKHSIEDRLTSSFRSIW